METKKVEDLKTPWKEVKWSEINPHLQDFNLFDLTPDKSQKTHEKDVIVTGIWLVYFWADTILIILTGVYERTF